MLSYRGPEAYHFPCGWSAHLAEWPGLGRLVQHAALAMEMFLGHTRGLGLRHRKRFSAADRSRSNLSTNLSTCAGTFFFSRPLANVTVREQASANRICFSK